MGTKSINTLVPDIYNLFKDDYVWNPDKRRIESFGQNLAKHIANRASETRTHRSFSLSSVGTPDRKFWFAHNRPDLAEPLPPEARIKFLFGDILEELLLFLAKEAGHTVTGQQDEVDINGVKGHRDAVIDGRLVDCKSASSYSFKKFQSNGLRSDDPFGYLPQLGAYLDGSSKDPTVTEKDVASFLVIDKQLGKITLDTYPKSGDNFKEMVDHKKKILELVEPPEQKCYDPVPEGKSGNEKLNVGCSYCAFKWSCWDGLRAFAYSSGPVFLSKVVKEPKVTEITQHGTVADNSGVSEEHGF